MKPNNMVRLIALVLIVILLSACASRPPSNPENICDIFREKKSWYKATEKTHKRYGVPPQVQMAIMYQESSFNAKAKPERKWILGIIPWFRPSSAYGYSQAKDETWDWYKQKTGNRWADRDDFADASDFIGWYANLSHHMLGISKWDAHNQYLAYHEGHGGYKRGTYRKKGWLIGVASKVDARARRYGAQYRGCKDDLGGWWPFW